MTTKDGGMSLRDWFAGLIIAAKIIRGNTCGQYDVESEDAYRRADAMLAEREKRE